MKSQRIISAAVAAVLAFGAFTVMPTEYSVFDTAIVSEAADSDFEILTDESGQKYLKKYSGSNENIVIPSDVEYIGNGAFFGNTKIKSVTVPEKCYSIGVWAFSGCSNLETVTTKGTVRIDGLAFADCFKLASVDIGGSFYDIIGEQAFKNCYSLNSFTVGADTYEYRIEKQAFANCYSLKKFDISDKCKEIASGAFFGCINLESITIPSKTKMTDDGTDSYYTFGYYLGTKSKISSVCPEYYIARGDGKSSTYLQYYTREKTNLNISKGYYLTSKKATPKKLVMTVAKDSDAEKYAKKHNIAYKYSSSGRVNEPSSSKTVVKESVKLPATKNIKYTMNKTGKSITLSWDCVPEADYYNIYVYDETAKKYKFVRKVYQRLNRDREEAISIPAQKGKTYKFKIVTGDLLFGHEYTGESYKCKITVK